MQPDNLIESLATLNQITETLNQAVNVPAALQTALTRLVELMGLETGWVFLKDPSAKSQWAGKGFTLAAHCGLPPALAPHRAAAWKGNCDCQTLCNRGQLIAAYNEVRCTRLGSAKMEERRELTVHASAPLRAGNQVLGILNVAAPSWDAFSPEALALLTNVGNQIGIALERARLFDLLQEQHIGEQAALLELSNQLLGRPRLDDLMRYLVQEIRRLLQVDACALVMPAEESGLLAYVAASGWRMDPVALGRRIPDDENNGPSLAMHSQLPIVAEDISVDALAVYLPGWLLAEGFHGHVAMPLIAEGRSIGALVSDCRQSRLLNENELRFFRLMANQAAIAIEGARLHEEELKRQRMIDELTVGKQIQRNMLPKTGPSATGWDFAALYEAARLVGGDFYDYFELPRQPRRLGMVIADVADKGVPAALFMAMSRSLIRSTAFSGRSPAAVLLRTNELIIKDSQTDLFLSAVYVMLELDNGRVTYANAGHNRPLWIRAAHDQIVELMGSGIVLGAFEDITVEEASITLAIGDALVLYTDGVTEATNAQDELFGKQRLLDVLAHRQHNSAQEIVNAIMAACNAFTEGREQSDDITMVVVKRTALPSSPTTYTP